jgi:hypothetical protein
LPDRPYDHPDTDPRDELPVGHRVFRLAVLAVLVAAAVAVGLSHPAAAMTGAVVDRGARLTRAVWRPLLTGDGWARPLLPGGATPSPAPSAAPHGR